MVTTNVGIPVIIPLEEQINGVENMMYMTSTSTNSGSASITVYFKQGTDPDMAAVNVQNRVSKAQALLPQEVTKIGVSTQKRQTSFLQIDALCSEDGTYDQDYISNYLLMPVVAIATCILVGWVIKPKTIIDEITLGGIKFGRAKLYIVMVKYVTPVMLVVLLAKSLNLL